MKLPQPCPSCKAPIMNYSMVCGRCGYYPPRKYSYDPACEELAKHFSDEEAPLTENELKDLAQDVQDAVEGFFLMRRTK